MIFLNMDATIVKRLRKVAIITMEEGTDKETNLTLNDEKNTSNIKTKFNGVSLTIFFDMGWSECSSEN